MNIVKSLATGIYADTFCIYREYIRNAATGIDKSVESNTLANRMEGRIGVTVDAANRLISIEGNSNGIGSQNVMHFLGSLTDSNVAMLAGLGHCEKLTFEFSRSGEPIKSAISLNASQLRLMADGVLDNISPSAVISVITTLGKHIENEKAQYFRVIMEGVWWHGILDKSKVADYLSVVAPVPFKDNMLSKSILAYLHDNNLPLKEYAIFINSDEEMLHKPHGAGIQGLPTFFKVHSVDRELTAIGWHAGIGKGVHQTSLERNIRLRKDNIRVGSDAVLDRLWGGMGHWHGYAGEVYAVGRHLELDSSGDRFVRSRSSIDLGAGLQDVFAKLSPA